MKKIINGKVYDTDKAHELGSDSHGYPRDFEYWCETLYQKRTGEYFLHGDGGPMTKYAVSIGQNQWTGGEKILPLSPDSARKWAEEHLDADDYESLFGLPGEEDDTKVTISAQLPTPLISAARRMAYEDGVSLTAVIERALALYTSELAARLYRVTFMTGDMSHSALVMVQQRPDGRWKVKMDYTESLDDKQCETVTVEADGDVAAIDAALHKRLDWLGPLDIIGHIDVTI